MKYFQFSNLIKKYLRVVLLLSIAFFNFGFNGVTTIYAAGAAPANDLIANATAIGSLPYTPGALDTTGAHQEIEEPNAYEYPGSCAGQNLRNGLASVWYTYTPGSNTAVYLDTSGSTTAVHDPSKGPGINYEYDTYIAVYTGTLASLPSSLTLFACDDNPNNNTNQAQLAFYATSGTTYYIQIAEYDGVQGDNHVYPGYNGGSLNFQMSAALTITGNVGISGAKVSYIGGAATANKNGAYTLAIRSGFSGTVTPSLSGAVFTPANKSYNNVLSNITGQNYVAKKLFNPIVKWVAAFSQANGWTVSNFVRTVGDADGNGKADVIGFGQDGVYVSLSNGSIFNPPSKWITAFDQAHGWTVSNYVRTVGDVNGDGKTDLVGFGQDGAYVALSNGSTFNAVSKWITAFDLAHGWTVSSYVRTVGDVNGDGKADLVGFGQDGVYVALSNGASFDPVTKWITAFDLAHGWTVSSYVRTVGDVNGDGKADLVGFGQDGVYVALSNGTGFDAISKWITAFDLAHDWTVSGFVRTVGDVNGDGKVDLVGFGQDGVYISTSNIAGSGFNSVSKWTSVFGSSNGWTVSGSVRTVGDVTGDGTADLVGFGSDGVYVAK